MAFKWNARTGELNVVGVEILTAFTGDPNDETDPEVTNSVKGTFFQPADNTDQLWLKIADGVNAWVQVNSEVTQVGAPAITSVSEALAFTWMGFGQ